MKYTVHFQDPGNKNIVYEANQVLEADHSYILVDIQGKVVALIPHAEVALIERETSS